MTAHSKSDEQAFREAFEELDGLAENSLGGAEGLDRASCSPAVVYLARVGIGAATRGCSAQGWRGEVSKSWGPEGDQQLAEAEECMRRSGLWPWP